MDIIQRTKETSWTIMTGSMKEIKHKINVYLQIAVGRAVAEPGNGYPGKCGADLTIYHRIHDGDLMEVRPAGRDGRAFSG